MRPLPAPAENPAPEPVPAPDTRLVELQYEVLDLRHKLEALSATPMLDAAAVTTLAAKAPAFTEVQYEVADLRHQVQTLQAELAALKAPSLTRCPESLAVGDCRRPGPHGGKRLRRWRDLVQLGGAACEHLNGR